MSTIKELRADKQKFRGEHAKFVEICNLLGAKLREQGQYNDAIAEHELAIEICSLKIKTPKIAKELEAISRRALGECFSEAGKHEQAKEEHDRYLMLAKQLNDPVEVQRAHATIGRTYLLWSNDSETSTDKDLLFKSAASFKRALDLCQQLKSVGKLRTRDYAEMKSRLLLNLALVYEELEDYEKCKKLLFESIELTKSNFLYEDLFRCQLSLGAILEEQTELDEAEKSYSDAYSTAKQLKSRTKKVDALHCLGLIAVKRKDFERARSKFKRAFLLKSPVGRDESERLLKVTSVLWNDSRQLKRLLALDADWSLDFDSQSVSREENDTALLKLYDRLGDHYCELKCFHSAIECYKSELEIGRDRLRLDNEQLAKIYVSIAQTCQDAKRYEEAVEHFKLEQSLQKNIVEKAESGLKICEMLECLFTKSDDDFDYDKRDSVRQDIFRTYEETLNILDLEQCLLPENNFKNRIIRNQILLGKRVLKAFIKASTKYAFLNASLVEKCKRQLNNIENILQQFPEEEEEEEEDENLDGNNSENAEDLYEKYSLENLSSCSSNSEDDDEEVPENFKINRKRNPNQAKVTKLNQFGETPLHTACIAGNIAQVERLLEQGAPLNAKDFCGWAPLHEACNHGHSKIVEKLLEAGANIEICDERSERITPLHDACICGNVDVIRILLKHGANLMAVNKKGETPVECLIDYQRNSEKELRTEEKAILSEIQTQMLKDMQKRGWKKVEQILNSQNVDSAKKRTGHSSTAYASSLRARNMKAADIYDDDDVVELCTPDAHQFDIDKAGNGRAEYKRAMEQLSRKNAGNGRKMFSSEKEDKALIEKDVVRDDWLIDDLGESGSASTVDKTKKRKDGNELSTKTKKVKRSRVFSDNEDNNFGEYDEDYFPNDRNQEFRREARYRDDTNEENNDDFDFCSLKIPENSGNMRHNETEKSALPADDYFFGDGFADDEPSDIELIEVIHKKIEQKSAAEKKLNTTKMMKSAENSPAIQGSLPIVTGLERSVSEPAAVAAAPSSSSSTATAPRSKLETDSVSAGSRCNQLVTVKFNDPERSSFALPITRPNQTVSWLRDELQRRYFRKFGVKPQLSLQTVEGALLSDEDSILDIIQIKDILQAQIDSYTTEEASKRYFDLCQENELEPETDVEKLLRKCSAEHCLRLDNAFWSEENMHSRIAFQALQRQDINEISLKFTNALLGSSWDCFVKLLSTLPKLQSLSLVGVGLPKGSIMALANLSPALRRLDLSWNSIGNEQIYALSQLVTMYDRLTVLSLNGCQLNGNILRNQLFIQSIARSNLESVQLDYNNDIDEQLIAKFKHLDNDKNFLQSLVHIS